MTYHDDQKYVESTPKQLNSFDPPGVGSALSDDDGLVFKTAEEYRAERLAARAEKKRKKRKIARSRFINNVMPLAALVLLICTVTYLNSLQFGLAVKYNDEVIATVANADVLEEANDIISNKMILNSLDTLNGETEYSVTIVNNSDEMQSSAELSRTILENDDSLTDEVCGVFVDGTYVASVESADEAQAVLEEILAEELQAQTETADTPDVAGEITGIDFNNSITLQTGLYATDSIVDADTLKERLLNNVELSFSVEAMEKIPVKIRYGTEYLVDETKESGYEEVTTEGSLGEGYMENITTYIDGVAVSSEKGRVIATVLPVTEVIVVSSENENAVGAKSVNSTGTDEDTDIDTDSDETDTDTGDTDLNEDTDSDVSGNVSASGTDTDEDSVSPDIGADTDNDTDTDSDSDSDSTTSSAAYQSDSGTSSSSSSSSSSEFIWPTASLRYITNYFGYNNGSTKLHKGIDISGAGAYGQSVLAAASGTVTEVVYDYGSEGYGCYVTIDHGNGCKTRYAQLSDIYVYVGEYVEQGEAIAAVGATGNATGAHLHFEIIMNGEYVDPTNYLH